MTYLKRFVAFFFALVLLFEEWGWVPLQRALSWVGSLPVIRLLEAKIKTLGPYTSLIVLFLPALHILPFKLAGLAAISSGHVVIGVSILLLAKVVGTALFAYTFGLVKPTLMTLGWFARVYGKWTAWKEQLFTWVRASWPWRYARYVKKLAKRMLKLS